MNTRNAHIAETVAWQGNRGSRKPAFGGKAPVQVTGHFVQHPGSSDPSNEIGAEPLPPDKLIPAILERLNRTEEIWGAHLKLDRHGKAIRVTGTVPSARARELTLSLVRGTPGVERAVASLRIDANA